MAIPEAILPSSYQVAQAKSHPHPDATITVVAPQKSSERRPARPLASASSARGIHPATPPREIRWAPAHHRSSILLPPQRGITYQPRASPWVPSPTGFQALKGRHHPRNAALIPLVIPAPISGRSKFSSIRCLAFDLSRRSNAKTDVQCSLFISPGSHRAKAIAAMDDEIELTVLRQMDEIALDGFHDWSFSRSGSLLWRMSVIWD